MANKADVNNKSGKRDVTADIRFDLPVVTVPVSLNLTVLSRAGGSPNGKLPESTMNCLVLHEDFLVASRSMQARPTTEDSFEYKGVKYKVIYIETYDGVAYVLVGEGSQ